MSEGAQKEQSETTLAVANLERLLDLQPVHIAELDAEFRVIYQNQNEFQFALGEEIGSQFPVKMRESCVGILKEVQRTGNTRHFEYAHSEERQLQTEVRRLGDETEGHHLCLLTRDITEITAQRARSKEDQQKLAVALEASQLGLWSWNLRTNLVIWDKRMRELTGHDIPINLPQWRDRLMHPDDRDGMPSMDGLIERGGPFPPQTARIVRPDGQVRWLMTTGTMCLGSDGQPESMVGGCIDVTDQQRLNEKLQSAQRMEAVGHLTAGVAHNFNNMLMVITPCLEAIEEVAVPEIRDDIADALLATERAAEVVRQLMAFAGQRNKRKRVSQPAAALVRDVVRLCSRSFEQHVRLSTEIDAKCSLNASPGAIQQVLSNVIFNARDALLSGNIAEPMIEVTCHDSSLFDEEWVEIVVADNGPGVPEHLRSKIFEPFVTTKNGKGTGLGLASSHAIVEQHGGQMACRTRNDGGTEFLILLPAAPPARPLGLAPPPASDDSSYQGAHVLLVDDEKAIRRLMRRGLEKAGFRVETAECPESLECVLSQCGVFDFVLLDRSLRASQGGSLLPRLRAALPDAKIFYFTGEHVDAEEAHLVDGVVQKPIDIRSLARVIQTATGQADDASAAGRRN